jgi:hypothetical protein
MRNCFDMGEHVKQTCFGEIATGRRHFEDEAIGLQMAF